MKYALASFVIILFDRSSNVSYDHLFYHLFVYIYKKSIFPLKHSEI